MYQHDIIRRLIERIGQFLARAAGLLESGQLDEAEGEVDQAEKALALPFGHERLDAASLALLLGGREKVTLLCHVLEQRALIAERRGQLAAASVLRQRAETLRATGSR